MDENQRANGKDAILRLQNGNTLKSAFVYLSQGESCAETKPKIAKIKCEFENFIAKLKLFFRRKISKRGILILLREREAMSVY